MDAERVGRRRWQVVEVSLCDSSSVWLGQRWKSRRAKVRELVLFVLSGCQHYRLQRAFHPAPQVRRKVAVGLFLSVSVGVSPSSLEMVARLLSVSWMVVVASLFALGGTVEVLVVLWI